MKLYTSLTSFVCLQLTFSLEDNLNSFTQSKSCCSSVTVVRYLAARVLKYALWAAVNTMKSAIHRICFNHWTRFAQRYLDKESSQITSWYLKLEALTCSTPYLSMSGFQLFSAVVFPPTLYFEASFSQFLHARFTR